MVVRLAITLLRRKMTIWKLNNIIINWLTNLQPNVLLDKWQFNTNQDWEILGDNFNNVNLETILNAISQAFGFHYSLLNYFQERALRFVDITEKPELVIEFENNG